jgi:transcription elongation factor GreA-like protein
MKDEYGKTPNDYFLMELGNMGMFVRDYDSSSMDNLCSAVKELHRELSKLDNSNIRTWLNVPLVEVLNAYARNQDINQLGNFYDDDVGLKETLSGGGS